DARDKHGHDEWSLWQRLKSCVALLVPVHELPGLQLELPRRQRLHPPALEARRRMGHARFPGDGAGHRIDVDRHGAAAVLPRCLADQIDEFRFVGHGRLLQVAKAQSAPSALTERFRNGSNWKEWRL